MFYDAENKAFASVADKAQIGLSEAFVVVALVFLVLGFFAIFTPKKGNKILGTFFITAPSLLYYLLTPPNEFKRIVEQAPASLNKLLSTIYEYGHIIYEYGFTINTLICVSFFIFLLMLAPYALRNNA